MGLDVSIYRSDYDADINRFHGATRVCVVNVSGPFEPVEEAFLNKIGRIVEVIPAAILVDGPNVGGQSFKVLVPAEQDEHGEWQPIETNTDEYAGPSFGGTYASSSDSRWSRATGTYGAIPVHDRCESWANYEAVSR